MHATPLRFLLSEPAHARWALSGTHKQTTRDFTLYTLIKVVLRAHGGGQHRIADERAEPEEQQLRAHFSRRQDVGIPMTPELQSQRLDPALQFFRSD